MNFQKLLAIFVVALSAVDAVSIDHDKVKPFDQPEAVTISEKAAVKVKPALYIGGGCASYPAVNAAGETSGGLKGTRGSSECESSLLGSQVYGRAGWFNDVWGIMYAWYFPKGFYGWHPSRRHDWASVVVWINNPELESPTITGLSISAGDNKYERQKLLIAAGLIPTLYHGPTLMFGPAYLTQTFKAGDFQSLIMWEQLTDEERTALNTTDFGRAKVPFSDAEFQERLEKAYLA